MPEAPANTNWYTYFPEDYRWSAAICGMVSSAQWGGTEIGEVDKVCRRLYKKLGDDNLWFREWDRMGDTVRDLGRAAERKNRPLRRLPLQARHLLLPDGRALPDAQGQASGRHVQEIARHLPPLRAPDGQAQNRGRGGSLRGRKKLPGYLVHAENTRKRKPPVVVFFDGLDVTKELQFTRGVEDLVRRGMSCLVMDGPGTGEAIRLRNIYLRPDYEVAGSAALDYLETRNDVDARNAGVMAISLGGYYAPRIASLEHRYKACLAWGAIWDYYATWKKRIEASFKAELSVPGHHIQWILNADSLDDALVKLEGFRLDGVVQNMRCPFLVTHGADDKQIPLRDAKALYNAVGSKDKTLKVFTVKEGGSQHCQRDNYAIGTTYMFDWMQEKLCG